MNISKTTINMAARRGFGISVSVYNAAELRQINRKVSGDDSAVVVEFFSESSDAAAWYIDRGNHLQFAQATAQAEEWPGTIGTEQQIRELLPAMADVLA